MVFVSFHKAELFISTSVIELGTGPPDMPLQNLKWTEAFLWATQQPSWFIFAFIVAFVFESPFQPDTPLSNLDPTGDCLGAGEDQRTAPRCSSARCPNYCTVPKCSIALSHGAQNSGLVFLKRRRRASSLSHNGLSDIFAIFCANRRNQLHM